MNELHCTGIIRLQLPASINNSTNTAAARILENYIGLALQRLCNYSVMQSEKISFLCMQCAVV